MFDELPTVSRRTLQAIGDRDFQDILDDFEGCIEKLKETNPMLWKSVEVAAEMVADMVEGAERAVVAGNAVVAMLVALRTVDLELERERYGPDLSDGDRWDDIGARGDT